MKKIEIKEISDLRKQLKSIEDKNYTGTKMAPLASGKLASGTGFFPFTDGLYKKNNPNAKFPKGQIMVLGQDFGNEFYVEDLISKFGGDELNNKRSSTWRTIENIYVKKYNLKLEYCFFTNVLMDLREGNTSMTGNFVDRLVKKRKLNENNLLNKNLDFFIEQLKMQQPKIIICLGNAVVDFISQLSFSDCIEPKIKEKKISEIDFISVIKNTKINYLENVKLVFFTHPSNWKLNIKHRKYNNNLTASEAEKAMLKDAMKGLF